MPCKSQNTVNPAGQVGGEPAADGQKFTYAVRAQGRLRTPEEFGDIIVRENADGGVVRVKDVARVELGSQDYSWITRLNGQPSAILGIYQLPGSNAVEAAKGVRKLMAKMKESFPADVDYAVTLDTTDAVRAGMHEIVQTLLRSFCPGDHRRLHLPARLAGDDHSDVRGAGLVDCDFRCLSRCSVSPSIPFRCLAWCWRSVWWSMTQSSWSKAYSTTLKRV